MYITQEEKDAYVNKLFSDVNLFEWDVLHVSSNTDRAEVMELIAEDLVHNTLKKELNFLYVKDLEDLSFLKLKSFIFKQIINEWLTFCNDVLMYPKADAINVVKQSERVKFIYNIVNSYFDKYQRLIYSEIIDTFFSLFVRTPVTKNAQILIERVLQSEFNAYKDTQKIYKFSQVFNRVKIAKNKKNAELQKLNSQIKELMAYLTVNDEIEFDEDNDILMDIEDIEYEIEDLEKTGIYEFDDFLAGLRDNMISSMIIIGKDKYIPIR